MPTRSIKLSLMAVVAIVATSLPARADYMVKEVGSFHVGGRTAALSGMPIRDVVFSPGAPPIKVDPNGEFAVEQMGTSNNTRFQRFLSWLSGRLQRSCRGESPIGDRFDAWPASVLCTMPHGLHP